MKGIKYLIGFLTTTLILILTSVTTVCQNKIDTSLVDGYTFVMSKKHREGSIDKVISFYYPRSIYEHDSVKIRERFYLCSILIVGYKNFERLFGTKIPNYRADVKVKSEYYLKRNVDILEAKGHFLASASVVSKFKLKKFNWIPRRIFKKLPNYVTVLSTK